VNQQTDFEPRIIAFCCNYCSYAGSDLAGISRMQYPPNVRIIRMMCTGRFDPALPLHAFERGADGILVCGCHPGLDCHFLEGNVRAEPKVKMAQELLDRLGIGSERLELHWISASEASKFVEVVENFVNLIKTLGPNPLRGGGSGEKK